MNEKSSHFFRLIRDYLTAYLPNQKGASKNTVKSYREALSLLLDYISSVHGLALRKLNFTYLSREIVEGFLDHIEKERGCSVTTRNNRLASIRSFVRYASERDISTQAYYIDLNKIPQKKPEKADVLPYFSESALKTILEQPDTKRKKGVRDLFFMILLYDTGARNQELLDIKLSDIHLEGKSPYVVITGKGRKTRLVPVMPKTVEHLKKYVASFHKERLPTEYLFYTEHNGKRCSMSPDNTERFIKKYGILGHALNKEVPQSLHPHLFRHSRSIHLYRSGMPMVLLSEWLGHAQASTTLHYYANADTTMKKDAIEKATSKLNPLVSGDTQLLEWENDDDMIRRLYGLSN